VRTSPLGVDMHWPLNFCHYTYTKISHEDSLVRGWLACHFLQWHVWNSNSLDIKILQWREGKPAQRRSGQSQLDNRLDNSMSVHQQLLLMWWISGHVACGCRACCTERACSECGGTSMVRSWSTVVCGHAAEIMVRELHSYMSTVGLEAYIVADYRTQLGASVVLACQDLQVTIQAVC